MPRWADGFLDPWGVKDFGVYCVYAPFSSFLDRDTSDMVTSDTKERTQYIPAEESLETLAE